MNLIFNKNFNIVKLVVNCFLLFTLLFSNTTIFSINSNWSSGTAHTLKENKSEAGVFGPIRYGLTDDLEIQAHPIWMFLLPSLTVRKSWSFLGKVPLVSEHSLLYPTAFLNFVAREGIAGLIPSDAEVPQIIGLVNGVSATMNINKYLNITPNMFLYLAAIIGEHKFSRIDHIFAYHRTSYWYNNVSAKVGVDFDGNVIGNFDYNLDLDVYLLNEKENNWAFEHSMMLSYRFTKGFRVLGGYKFFLSSVPWSNTADWIFAPLIDFEWSIQF